MTSTGGSTRETSRAILDASGVKNPAESDRGRTHRQEAAGASAEWHPAHQQAIIAQIHPSFCSADQMPKAPAMARPATEIHRNRSHHRPGRRPASLRR
jgi:hypothetical protein